MCRSMSTLVVPDILFIVLSTVLLVTGTGANLFLECKVQTTLRLLTLLDAGSSTEIPSVWSYVTNIHPALDLAAEQINNRSDLLPCHKLELVHKEAGCVVGAKTAVGLTSGLFPSDDRGIVVGIIGPVCSPDSIQVSSITNRPEVQLVVLHNAWSPVLSDRTRFPNALGILGSTQPLEDLLQVLMKKSGWSNVAILYENTRPFYSSLAKSFIASIKDVVNVRYLSTVTSNFYPLQEVWNSKARIVFLFTSTEHSRRIMCLAQHMKLVYPSYQWVIVSQGLDDFKNKDPTLVYQNKRYSCSQAMLVNTALDSTLLINYQFSTPRPEEAFKKFLDLYVQRVTEYNSEHPDHTISTSYRAYNMYDAVWAWAIVLDELTSNNNGLVFEYGNKTLANMVLEKFYSIDLQGVSGHIRFDSSHGFVSRPANLYQIVSGEEKHIGYSNGTEVVTLQGFEAVPDVVRVVSLPHKGIISFFLVIQSIELIIVAVLHVLTLLYRNTRMVKASSPKLIQSAFVGTYTLILTMMLFTLFFAKEHSPIVGILICQSVWSWLMPLTFTLTMGIVSLRTWRLHRIFTHYLNPGKSISNPALFSALLIMVSIDAFIGTVWTIVDRMRIDFEEFTADNRPANELLLDQSCVSSHVFVWIGVLFAYKIILLLFMVALSFLTRNIPNRTFATTSLRAFSYIFSILFFVGFCLYFFFRILDKHSDISFILLCAVLNIVLLLILLFILTPPLIPVIQDKLKKR